MIFNYPVRFFAYVRYFKERLAADRYFLFARREDVLSRVRAIWTQQSDPWKSEFAYTIDDVSAYINTYFLGEKFNRFCLSPTLLNALKTKLPIRLLQMEGAYFASTISYIYRQLLLIGDILLCNCYALMLIVRTLLSRKKHEKFRRLVYFVGLKKENCITTELPSYLDRCMADPDINPEQSAIVLTDNNLLGLGIDRASITAGDLLSKRDLPCLVWRLMKLNALAFINLFFQKTFFQILFRENFKKLVVASSVENKLISLVFDGSYMGYTPLWSRNKNVRTFLIFYSTNFGYNYDAVRRRFWYPFDWYYMKWDHIFVWDRVQKQLLSSFAKHSQLKIISKLNFIDSGESFSIDSDQSNLIIFDISPRRLTNLSLSSNLGDFFYSSEYMMKFVLDIVSVAEKLGIVVYLKKKRKIDSECRRYRAMIQGLSDQKRIRILEEAISPERIIGKMDMVISPVYSTPSLIASTLAVKSCYYDPASIVDKSYPFNRTVPIISGHTRLDEFLNASFT